MKKFISSNWINLLGTITALYLSVLLMALGHLFKGQRGFTFETVIVETIGGSFMYFFGVFMYHFKALMIYTGLLLLVSSILFSFLNGKHNVKALLVIECILFTVLFIFYIMVQQSLSFLTLPLIFGYTQWLRYKHIKTA